MQPFTEKVINVIKAIPAGSIMTYGQIAGACGSPRAARQVVRILHSSSAKHKLPWHRVVNAKGQIAMKDQEAAEYQRMLLEAEGIFFKADGSIPVYDYLYHIEQDGCHELEIEG